MYEIQLTRAGRPLERDEAVRLAADGLIVTVAAVGADSIVIYNADVLSVDGTDGEPGARVRLGALAPVHDAASASIAAAVIATSAGLAASVDALLARRDAALEPEHAAWREG